MLFFYNMVLFALFFIGRDYLRYNCDHSGHLLACDLTLRMLGVPIPDYVFLTLTGVLGGLAALAVLLIGHLTLYHIYLSKPCNLHLNWLQPHICQFGFQWLVIGNYLTGLS